MCIRVKLSQKYTWNIILVIFWVYLASKTYSGSIKNSEKKWSWKILETVGINQKEWETSVCRLLRVIFSPPPRFFLCFCVSGPYSLPGCFGWFQVSLSVSRVFCFSLCWSCFAWICFALVFQFIVSPVEPALPQWPWVLWTSAHCNWFLLGLQKYPPHALRFHCRGLTLALLSLHRALSTPDLLYRACGSAGLAKVSTHFEFPLRRFSDLTLLLLDLHCHSGIGCWWASAHCNWFC